MKHDEAFIIFSVQKANETKAANMKAHLKTVMNLNLANISYVVTIGNYEGIREPSYLVSFKHEQAVQELCAAYNQECYLYVDGRKLSMLIKPDGTVIKTLGFFKEIYNVDGLANYTEFEGRYFAA